MMQVTEASGKSGKSGTQYANVLNGILMTSDIGLTLYEVNRGQGVRFPVVQVRQKVSRLP